MNIEKLFSGIAVIIDNEINDRSSSIYRIKELIEKKSIPVLTFPEIPSQEVIPALSGAAFVILDWDYTDGKIPIEEGERILIPGALVEAEESRLISFITQLLKKLFVPVFVFTAKSKEMVIDRLKDANLWKDDRPNRVFVKQKDEVGTDSELFSAIAEWTKEMPSVYVLKKWALTIQKAQNDMFNEFYSYSPNWANIIWDMLKDDSIDNQHEFGSFVTRSLLNRIEGYSFEEAAIQSEATGNTSELRKVVESERFLQYHTQPDQAYTGDLFKDGSDYYLNIRAQCSIARMDQQGNYNPVLYCIKGKKLRNQDIIAEDIHLTTEKELVFSASKHFSLDHMYEICGDISQLEEFNRNFSKHRNKIFFRKGTILERDDKVIIGCIAGEQAIIFNMDIEIRYFNEMKDKRIGRVLPPYITKIQQKTAANMVREGVTPLPKELFISFDE